MSVWKYFEATVQLHPANKALWVNDTYYSYEGLNGFAAKIAEALSENTANEFIGVLAQRSVEAFAAVLGILKSEKAYVPLNPTFPRQRLISIIRQANLKTIIVEPAFLETAIKMAYEEQVLIRILSLEIHDELCRISETFTGPVFENNFTESGAHTDRYAYMLFTSGSTGIPKGVPVSIRNLSSYIETIRAKFEFSDTDRFSNIFDLNFDLSVHDMLICWSSAACLYCIPENYVMAPAAFIREHSLSCWFSTPSTIMVLDKLRLLKAGAFPSLRLSLFCGEAFPERLAVKWREAAPNSMIFNLYGPTEATIAISSLLWTGQPEESLNGILSIGKIFENHSFSLELEGNADSGELLLSGPQVVNAYWNSEEMSSRNFMYRDSTNWYKTGDLVSEGKGGNLFFRGRTDFQVKIQGRRIELAEIDHVISKVSGASSVVTIVITDVKEKIYLVSCIASLNSFSIREVAEIKRISREFLPAYMIPEDILIFAGFPLNSNGKTDRLKLAELAAKRLNIKYE